MPKLRITAPRIAGIATCVPSHVFDNLKDTVDFTPDEVRKVVAMAGVNRRHTAVGSTCSSDLCVAAAERLLARLGWDRESIDGLIFATQTPDHFLPSTSCLAHQRLGLSKDCAAYDLGLGCSGTVYGLWQAAMMLAGGGCRRVLLLHGETPTLYADRADRSVSLLFGDAGSAILLERTPAGAARREWTFVLHTDGSGARDLIVEGGGFRDRFNPDRRKHCVAMNGSNVFNFTIHVLPPLIRDTLALAEQAADSVDYYVFHQSNRFIMRHILKKTGLAAERVPMVLKDFGNTGGPSIPLAITCGGLRRESGRPLSLMLLGYGVGLSWGSALLELEPEAALEHCEWSPPEDR
jgi:3-oxoacyl-[acyl-carrier-protein] synthase-3